MALIVETGTGASNSESYCSITDATTYHANRGNSTWALLTVTQQEQALRRATDYIGQSYRLRWQGYRTKLEQALDWPRYEIVVDYYRIVPSTTIPVELINATAELALKASAGELLSDTGQTVIRQKVDVIEVEYDKYSKPTKQYNAIEAMLSPYFRNNSGVEHGLIR